MDDFHFAGRMVCPLGDLMIFLDGNSLAKIEIESAHPGRTKPTVAASSDALFNEVQAQLESYFRGEREAFVLPLAPPGTAFDRKIWAAVRAIPYGQTVSYAEIARRVGRPGAARAVGSANARNPLMIVTPCHRVVTADGRLVGTAMGCELRRQLLEHEGVAVLGGRVVPSRRQDFRGFAFDVTEL